jgi:hypothetical protein
VISRYGLGLWNPAGAISLWYQTEEERSQRAHEFAQTGWTVWPINTTSATNEK